MNVQRSTQLSSHSSVAAKPPVHAHKAYTCTSKHVHGPSSIVASFHMLKNTHTQQHPAHNPLPQSTGRNIPVSHPGLPNDDITSPRETGTPFTRYEVAEPDSKGSLLSWAHMKTAVYNFGIVQPRLYFPLFLLLGDKWTQHFLKLVQY